MNGYLEYFHYLDSLRKYGRANMFTEAGGYLREHFGMSRELAHKIHSEWMTTFGDRQNRGELNENYPID